MEQRGACPYPFSPTFDQSKQRKTKTTLLCYIYIYVTENRQTSVNQNTLVKKFITSKSTNLQWIYKHRDTKRHTDRKDKEPSELPNKKAIHPFVPEATVRIVQELKIILKLYSDPQGNERIFRLAENKRDPLISSGNYRFILSCTSELINAPCTPE